MTISSVQRLPGRAFSQQRSTPQLWVGAVVGIGRNAENTKSDRKCNPPKKGHLQFTCEEVL